jgi:hypothetical protein
MTDQTFRDLLTRRPFEPFRVITSSGNSYEVRHAEMAWLTRTTLYIGTGGDAADGVPAEARLVSLPHITTIEPITPQQAA